MSANPTNFVPITGPLGQKLYFAAPQVLVITDTDPLALQTAINLILDGLALPLQETKYTVLDIQYTSAQESNNIIQHSALIRYQVWTAV